MIKKTPIPVKEGQEMTVKIENLGSKGDGITKIKGYVLFIKNTKINKTYKVKITKITEKAGFAEVIQEENLEVN